MATHQKQIFQTNNPTRWNSFVWGFRLLLVFLVIGIAAVLISILHKETFRIPDFSIQVEKYKKLSKTEIQQSLKEERADFQKSMDKVRASKKRNFYEKILEKPSSVRAYLPVRAGFYVNWDDQSFYSLRNNIHQMNMVLPEWLFVADSSDKVAVSIDEKALNVMRKSKVAVVPMISNYYNDQWNSNNVHRIITSPNRRTVFINSIIEVLDKYHFQGVNIDFEDLNEKTDEYLISFQRELCSKLHEKGYIVTQDVAPFNPDYNYRELNKYNDFIFLMGYDQHNASSLPGSIAEYEWIRKALFELNKEVPSSKIVLCFGAYGYDWAQDCEGEDITFQDAINIAIANKQNINFSNTSYGLSFNYTDANKVNHQVYFTDAVSGFNTIRLAEDFNSAGVAVWRLGSEDTRLWKFYRRSLSLDSLSGQPFEFSEFEQVHSSYNVDFIGDGEIMDIISAPHPGKAAVKIDSKNQLITNEEYQELPASYIIERTGADEKKIAITFDDGPDERYTPDILKVLKSNNVHATFFVTGVNSESNLPLLKKIYTDGNEIGNHTFSHPNLELISDNRIRLELRITRILIESITGHSTILFRPPYNTDSEPRNPLQISPLVVAKDENFLSIGASIDPNDWEKGISADSIVARAINQESYGNILLLHDAGGDRSQTVIALPRIIEYFKKKGYQFVTVSELLKRKRDDVMPPVSGRLEYAEAADSTIFQFTYLYQHFLYGLFFLALILVLTRITAVAVFAMINHRKGKNAALMPPKEYPKVSILVPAYNEEVTAAKTIENLLKCDYPAFEILFVDDGSKDKTYEKVKEAYGSHPLVKVLTKPNGGKASALNFGIEHSTSDYLVCIDADTLLTPDAISKMMPMLLEQDVAAVAGNVKVGNKVNMLTNWQSIEYTTSQNFDRLAFDFLNAIMVVPGAIGAFKKAALIEAGGFTTDTLAEDCDLTLRLLRLGYRVRTCNSAISLTEAPETLRMFMKQRFRWSFGIMQSFWKHRDLLFARRRSNMGWILLPNILVFQLILPLFSPIVDILTIIALFSKSAPEVLIAYGIFFVVDCIISALAFGYDKQRFTLKTVAFLFVQRVVYRQFLFVVLIRSYLKALKGELASWGVLKRTGNVQQV